MPHDPPASNAEAEKRKSLVSALDSWNRTFRLCVINLTIYVPLDVLAWAIRR